MVRKRKGKGLSMRKIREVLRLMLVQGMGDRKIGRSYEKSWPNPLNLPFSVGLSPGA